MAEEKQAGDKLSLARRRFAYGLERSRNNRDLAVEDMRFLAASPDNGWQWPAQIKNQRETDPEGPRPCLTVNKLPQHVNQVVNDGRQNRPAIKVLPVDDKSDPETAEIITGIVRHIEHQSDADVAYDTALGCAVGSGEGYIRVITDYCDEESFDQDVFIKRVRNPLSIVDDPDIQTPEGSDRKWCFIVEELTKEEYEEKYPDAEPIDWQSVGKDEAFKDWLYGDKIRVAEYWFIETTYTQLEAGEKKRKVKRNKVRCQKVNGIQVLEEYEWAGKYIPIARVVGNEYDIEGELHTSGLVRNAKDAQRMYNYWSSQETEMIALAPKAPFVGAAGQFDGYEEKWKRANVVSYAYLEYNPISEGAGLVPPPQRQMPPMPQQAIVTAKLAASDDIKSTTGQYDASLGQRSNETSGKAIMARQREGDIGTFHYIDNLGRAIKHIGRIVVDLIPKIYDTERVARILGEDGEVDQVAINPNAPQGMSVMRDDVSGKEIGKIYNPGVGRYDVRVSIGPSYTTKRQESAEAMGQMVTGNPALWGVIGDLLIRAQDWPGADEMAKRIKATIPPNVLQEEEDDEQAARTKIRQLMTSLQAAAQQIDVLKAEVQARDKDMAKIQADTTVKMEKIARDFEAAQQKNVTDVHLENIKTESAESIAKLEAKVDLIIAGMSAMRPAQTEKQDGR